MAAPAAHFAAYLVHFARLRPGPSPNAPAPAVPHVDPETMRALGWVGADRRNAFFRFDPGEARERIGCFGDSFTWGDEVEDGLDYPALLERAFAERGRPAVQVLNFGSNWYGFHQTYLLWESVGTEYGLDTVVLGPASFQEDRDTTFNHTGDFEPAAIHARYVLDGEGVRRVDPIGDTPYRRYRRYYAYWTPEVYRRFDRRPPVFLRCFLPGRLLPGNPFYYFEGTIEEEARETYRRLLRRMASRVRRVVLVHQRTEIVELARGLGLPNLDAEMTGVPLSFPYLAPRGHYSPTANRLLARQVLDRIEGRERPTWKRIEVSGAETGDAVPADSGVGEVRIESGGSTIGHFYRMGRSGFPERVRDLGAASGRGLVAIRGERQSVLDALFVPGDALGSGRPFLRVRSASGVREVSVGETRRLDPRVPLEVLVVPGASVVFHTHLGLQASLEFDSSGLPPERAELLVPLEDALFVRAYGEVLLEETSGGGTFDLVLPGDLQSLRIPLARWSFGA